MKPIDRLSALTSLALILLSGAAVAQSEENSAPIANDSDSLAVIEVFGERAGPGLWRVRRGDNTVYILGTFNPLPRRMTWRSTQVESVLDQSAQLIPYRPDIDAKLGPIKAIKLYRQWRRLRVNPGDQTLDQVLTPEVYERFAAARVKYGARDDDILELRPLLAASELSQAAVKTIGLKTRDDVTAAVLKMAKQRKVEIVKLTQRVDDIQATLGDLANIETQAEQQCLATTVTRLDAEIATLRDQVNAWAVGDIARLRSQHTDAQRESCWNALISAPRIKKITSEFDRMWFDAVVRALEINKTTLAVSPIGRLLQRDGVLAQLAARGYEVEPP